MAKRKRTTDPDEDPAFTREMSERFAQAASDGKSLDLSQLDLDKLSRRQAIGARIGRDLPGLQSLNLWGCKQITDAGVQVVAEHCGGLQSLHL